MANLPRSAKSGSDWGQNELDAFNIRIANVPAEDFFGAQLADITLDDLPPAIVTQEERGEQPMSREERYFFGHMRDAATGEESAVDDFAALLLQILQYDCNERRIRQHKELKMIMCGQTVYAKPDVCVVQGAQYLLQVEEDKAFYNAKDAEPQLVAEMIASFYNLNLIREEYGQDRLDKRVVPGIIMRGIVPRFYLLEVTEELLSAVKFGTFPQQATTLKKCVPPMDLEDYNFYGMRKLEVRKLILRCFIAFKKFLVEVD